MLTNSFQGLEEDISFISSDYDIVYMFGVDKHMTDKKRIQTCAKNNNEKVNSGFDILYFGEKLRIGEVSYTVSNNPTCYLCNAAYYHMLRKNSNTVFIHIPSLRGMSIGMMKRLIKIFRNIYFV